MYQQRVGAKRSVSIIAGWLGLLFPVCVYSTNLLDLPLESLVQIEYEVSSASKFTQTSSRAPTTVQVIDAEAIRRHGWRTLGEMLSSLPGMLTGSDRGYDFFGVRGFQQSREFNHRFLLAIDGQRINDPIYEQAMIGDEFPLDVSLIERVEYVDGPGSSIYGANAIFGVINVITRRADRVPGAASLALSSDGWRLGNGSVSTRFENDSALTLGVTLGDKAGRDVNYSAPPGYLLLSNGSTITDGVARGLDRTGMVRLFARWEMDETDLTLTHGTRRHHPSAPIYGALFNDPALYLEDTSSRLSLSGKRELSESVLFQGHLAYNRMSFTGDYPYFDPGPGGVGYYLNRDQTEARWWSGEGYLVYSGLSDHKLVSGVEFQRETVARQQNMDLRGVNVNVPLDVATAANTQGVYVQDEWAFAPGWLANLGLRYDRHSRHGGSAYPRLALVWQPTEGSALKLLVGSAYRNPSAYEAYYSTGAAWLANPALRSEAIHTLQLVGEQRIGESSQLVATLFQYHISNLISQVEVSPGVWQYQNGSSIVARGGDLALIHRSASGLRLDASLAMQNVVDHMGVRYDNSPSWSGRLNASQPLAGEALLLAGEFRLVGSRSFVWVDGVRRTLPVEPILDLTLSAPHLAGGLSAQLRLTNVFNRHSFVAASPMTMSPLTPVYGRTGWVSLNYAY